uniref:Uncharacterized protein n=1 Tax=Octopus bimaculoides TaxID=37653 RepID=A0A0L8I842_OCTBM
MELNFMSVYINNSNLTCRLKKKHVLWHGQLNCDNVLFSLEFNRKSKKIIIGIENTLCKCYVFTCIYYSYAKSFVMLF